jgi:hypothetical protein
LQGYFENGVVTLGGNNAPGARGAYSMYIVFFEEPDFSQTPEGSNQKAIGAMGLLCRKRRNCSANYPIPSIRRPPYRLRCPMICRSKWKSLMSGPTRSFVVDQILPAGNIIVWDSRNEEGIRFQRRSLFLSPAGMGKYLRNGMKVKENDMRLPEKCF